MQEFAVEVAAQDRALTLAVTGALDVATAGDLWAAGSRGIDESEAATVLLDMAGVDFLDSSGVSALVKLRKHAVGAGAVFQVLNPRPPVRRVLDLSGLSDLLEPS